TASDKSGDETLLGMARAYHQARQGAGKKGYLVPLHFLDRPTSGVVLFAVSSKAAARLSAAFREGRIEKLYYAIVEGQPPQESAELKDFLLKDHGSNIVTVAKPGTPGAKACSLHYEVLKRSPVLSASGRPTSANFLSCLEVRP